MTMSGIKNTGPSLSVIPSRFAAPAVVRIEEFLCSQKNEAIVKYSVLNDTKQVFASKYQLTLPSAKELQREMEEERRRIEEKEM